MTDLLGDMKRTHHCCELTTSDIDNEVVLMGWVQHMEDAQETIREKMAAEAKPLVSEPPADE